MAVCNVKVPWSDEDVREYISDEITWVFLEENLAFEFRTGSVWRRGRRHTTDMIARAEVVLGDPRLDEAPTHYIKVVKYFRHASSPDPENAVKEAVCAVEATAKSLFPDGKKKTLADVVKAITGSENGKIPSAIAKTFDGLYGFTTTEHTGHTSPVIGMSRSSSTGLFSSLNTKFVVPKTISFDCL